MIKNFRGLLDDKIRIMAFKTALEECVNEETTVLEIGAALGTYSFFAAQAGAKAVYAVEMDDVFHVGKEIARRNQLQDKINFIKGKSTEIELPEKADYIILEDYAPIFLYEGLEKTITDARKRFLKPGGAFIPGHIILNTAPVEAVSLYNEINLWQKEKDFLYGINWEYTTELAFNRPYYSELHQLKPLTEASHIKTINLAQDENFPFSHKAELVVTKDGTLHGLAGWWDTWFTPNIYFSNSPTASANTWGQMFFPFEYPIQVKVGDTVKIQLHVLESVLSKSIDFKWRVEHSSSIQEQNSFKGRFLPQTSRELVNRE